MTTLNLSFKTNFGSNATFKGAVEPLGESGYKFSGTLEGSMGVERANTGFKNTIRLGHGGTTKGFTFLNFTLEDRKSGTFPVTGQGERTPKGTVEFILGANEGLSGQFAEGGKQIITLDEH